MTKPYTENHLPRQGSIIVAVDDLPGTPVRKGDTVVFLGAIPNMPGHIIVATARGRVLWGYHPDSFKKATDDEI